MKNGLFTVLVLLFFVNLFSSDHGIYMKVVKNAKPDFEVTVKKLEKGVEQSSFALLETRDVATPDLVREGKNERSGFKAAVLLLTSDAYIKTLTKYGNKYLAAGFLKIGVYQDEDGTHITITDPETINRIIFNDLNDEKYQSIISETIPFKEDLIKTVHALNLGDNVKEPMEPIRDDEDLRDASKDMFMMVGPMTFFQDEDQFPVIFDVPVKKESNPIPEYLKQFKKNIANFTPAEDDIDYRWSQNGKKDLQWEYIEGFYSPDSTAYLFGLTRSRTEALSFQIAGESRADEKHKSPGLDHLTAFPIEVLVILDGNRLKVMTAREMFRMDMYFWDAGKMAFMNYMQMPATLDESIKKAILGK